MEHALRKFESKDAPMVKDLILAILAKEYPFDKSAYSDSDLDKIGQTYGGKRETFFVIDEDGKIAGTVGIKEDAKDEALMRRLFVSADCRKRGYGTELVDAAVKFCRENGYKKIFFRCTGRMKDAMSLCAKKGFVKAEELEISGFKIHKLEFSI